MTRSLLAAAAAVSALVAPAGAHASSVHMRNDHEHVGFVVVEYNAEAGERNRARVSFTPGTPTTPLSYTVRDPAAVIDAGAGCTSINPHEARCDEVGLNHIWSVVLHLRDGDDSVATVNRTRFAGPALEAYGGSGRDRLTGGDTTDVLDGGSGRDVVDGGPGFDTVSYVSRRRRVRVDLRRGTGGQRGERDVLRDLEDVDGGHAGDRIAGDSVHNHLVGNGGRDRLVGRGGDDWLEGRRGRDRLVGGGADDLLYPGAGLDSLSCGSPGTEDVVSHPIAGERMSRHCDAADYSDDDGNSFRVRPNPISVSRKRARFAIGCPSFEADDGGFRDCGGGIVVRARRSQRVLGRGFVGPYRSERSIRPAVVRLTKLGRRLSARRGGVDADVSLHDDMPHVAWTIGLER